MHLFTEPFQPAFMQHALLAGLIAVLATSLMGTWIVLRGMSFLGDALAHGVIPGVALAILFGFSPLLGAFLAALTMSGLVTVIGRRTSISEDTGIGLLFVGMLSLGVVIVSKTKSFTADLTSILFGDILAVSTSDLVTQATAAAVVLIGVCVLYRPLVALAFNSDKATTLKMRPGLTQLAMLVLVVVSIVASFQAIGTLLVFGLLIGPPATASLIGRRIPWVMVLSVLFGSLAVVCGLIISFHHGTAGGATISTSCVAQFFIVLVIRESQRMITKRFAVSTG